ncbi:MAG TPA: NADH-quinone oxidoreductase subunit NuoK [Phycisphaerae bacterium]|jgi:NADH-quinone oxidoreductase subunit K|nr:NADH-quinone oxidoreductase subunit NuoK [Phycisphaerae bacterium]
MSQIELYQYLAVGAILFAIGVVGFLARRNMIMMFLCTEIMFQGVAINLVAFSRFHLNSQGLSFVIFLLTIAAAEASLALGLVVLLFRKRETLNVDEWSEMQG